MVDGSVLLFGTLKPATIILISIHWSKEVIKMMKTRYFYVAILAMCVILSASVIEAASKKINVVMNYTIEGDHSPWFVALEKGYFPQQGLDVTIQRGYGSPDTVKKVATGVAHIGFADMGSLIMAIADGIPAKAIMGGNMSEPCALFSAREDANITTPKEAEGKTIGGPPADVCIVFLGAVMEQVGADYSKVKIINMDAPTRLPMLAAGKIDSAASFYEKEILFKKALQQANKTMVSFRFDKYLDKYSCAVIAHDKIIKEEPGVLKGFIVALLKGYKDVLKDPDFGGASIMRLHPEFDRDYIYGSAKTLPDLVWDETTRTKGIGVLSRDKVFKTINITNKYWPLKRSVTPDEVFTNDFIIWAHSQVK